MGRRAKPAKGKADAKPPLAGRTQKDEGAKVRDLEKRLAEALKREQVLVEQQMATSEILKVISSSPADVRPVFDAIAGRAAQLCDALFSTVYRYDGTLIHHAADNYSTSEMRAVLTRGYPSPVQRDSATAAAIRERRIIHIEDVLDDATPAASREVAVALNYRTVLCVPMLRDGVPIGSIAVARRERRPFSDKQIDLIKTFADQAVIAIEDVRLFKELEARNNALTESLDQQTATSEVLRVISSTQTDLEPVFATIVQNAGRVCDADDAVIALLDGAEAEVAAHWGPIEATLGSRFPLTPGTVLCRAILDVRAVHVDDLSIAADFPQGQELASRLGYRTTLAVPLLRASRAIGGLLIRRAEMRPFSDKQIAMLQTFADQAVIAIENVRLFTELQQKNEALTQAHAQVTEALEQQTATSEILKVIASSPTDTQPVFDAIAENAARLCGVDDGFILLVDGDALRAVSVTGQLMAQTADYNTRRVPVSRTSVAGRAIVDRATIHIADLAEVPEAEFPEVGALQQLFGHHTMLATPLLREGAALGAIVLFRFEVRSFSERQIELLKTFADQAVIAIENVRLFTELQASTAELTRSVDELTALGDVGRVLSSTLDLETVLQTIVTRANQLTGTAGCTIWEYDEAREEFRLRVSHYADAADAVVLQALGRVTTLRRGQGVTTRVVERRQPVQIRDIAAEGAYESPIRQPLIEAGHRALLGVPLLSEDEVIGVLAVTRKTPGEFEPEIVRLLTTFATQSALAIQNARLFREIEDKSRQLEVASQHKSEFLANMSHELRTPLNAIIGFSEVLTERMFGELNEKQDEYLKDIYASGQHLLSLINDILDLAKIEAGRMELEPEDFDLPSAIDNALTLVRERAGRRGITLGRAIDERVGTIRADERKVKQVLLNLLSNALKFTPEGGRIDVRAAVSDGMAEVSVADTGVGIAPEDQEAVFEEFRQVGKADTKAEGTGLGLALCRKFVELHGGRIAVTSRVGQGATFTFTLPLSP